MRNALRERKRVFNRESAELRAYLKAHGLCAVWRYMPAIDFSQKRFERFTGGGKSKRCCSDSSGIIRELKKSYSKGRFIRFYVVEDFNKAFSR